MEWLCTGVVEWWSCVSSHAPRLHTLYSSQHTATCSTSPLPPLSSSSLTPPERCSRAETAVGRREKGALLEAGVRVLWAWSWRDASPCPWPCWARCSPHTTFPTTCTGSTLRFCSGRCWGRTLCWCGSGHKAARGGSQVGARVWQVVCTMSHLCTMSVLDHLCTMSVLDHLCAMSVLDVYHECVSVLDQSFIQDGVKIYEEKNALHFKYFERRQRF